MRVPFARSLVLATQASPMSSVAGGKDAHTQPNSSSLLELVKKADALHKNGTSVFSVNCYLSQV